MIDEIVACLDGSEFAEAILPYAVGISRSLGAQLSLLRILEDGEAPAAAEDYLKRIAGRHGAREKLRKSKGDAASAILDELREKPLALAAMTTHGRTGMLEAILGSVAFRVVRGARRPILLYRPPAPLQARSSDAEIKIATVTAALDGQDFSTRILPHAAEIASALKARLELIQVLPSGGAEAEIPAELRRDVLESSYLQREAHDITRKHGLEVDWEVLHGEPAEAIISYLKGRRNVLLAMTSHARLGLERTIFGSVAAECLRRAGVPLLVYWPSP
ncbi:MAG: universal stress protein [Deltaproteobacteria bacterium]|nr:universal stress protein [Deltaproteobacteria bacterium]